jgi:hypothetical protein
LFWVSSALYVSQSVFKKLVGSPMGTNCAVYGQLTSTCLLGDIVFNVLIMSFFSFYFPFKWLLLRSFVDDVGSSNSLTSCIFTETWQCQVSEVKWQYAWLVILSMQRKFSWIHNHSYVLC